MAGGMSAVSHRFSRLVGAWNKPWLIDSGLRQRYSSLYRVFLSPVIELSTHRPGQSLVVIDEKKFLVILRALPTSEAGDMTDTSRRPFAAKPKQSQPVADFGLEPQLSLPILQPRRADKAVMRDLASAENEDAKRIAEKLAAENESLRQCLTVATGERDDMQDAVDKILTDLMDTQQELEESKEAKAESDAESLLTRQMLERELKEKDCILEDLRIKVGRLELETKHAGQSEDSLVKKESNDEFRQAEAQKLARVQLDLENSREALVSNEALVSRLETTERERKDLQLKTEELEVLLRSKDSTILQLETLNNKAKQVAKDLGMELDARSQVSRQLNEEVQQLRSSSALEISQLRAELEVESRTHSETKRMKESQAIELSQLRDHEDRLDSKHQIQTNQEMDRTIAAQAAELEQMRPMYDFFRKSSERLSQESKDMMGKIRELEDSLVSRDRQIAEQAQHIASLLAQVRERQHRPY